MEDRVRDGELEAQGQRHRRSCGHVDDDRSCGTAKETDSADNGEGSVTVENCGSKQTFDSVPKRVVILNGGSVGEAESFVKLGIEDSIVATHRITACLLVGALQRPALS